MPSPARMGRAVLGWAVLGWAWQGLDICAAPDFVRQLPQAEPLDGQGERGSLMSV